MLRRLSPLVALLLFFLLASCNGEKFELPLQISLVQLGYEQDNSENSDRFDEGQVAGSFFVAFNDKEVIESGKDMSKEDFGGMSFLPSRYEAKEDISTLQVRVYPNNAKVDHIKLVSSNPEVMEIVSVKGKDVEVRCHNLGETTLTVTVQGALNTVQVEYPIRVVSKVDIDFYITKYWFGAINTRLRCHPTSLPFGRTSVATMMKDSISVVGYCEYYDFKKYGRQMLVKRDTITFPAEEKSVLLSLRRKTYIRNITSAVREFKWNRKELGSKITVHSDGTRDTLSCYFSYVVEQVILDFEVYGADPYMEFHFNSMYDRTTDVAVVDEKTGEPTGEIEDSGTDENEEFDFASTDDSGRIKREESAYFVIRLNDFLSDEERDKACNDFRDRLDELNYDEDKLSDEEKDKALEEIDKHKNDDEK